MPKLAYNQSKQMPICEFLKKGDRTVKLNKIKAKSALLSIGRTQTELSSSLNISRRWIGTAFNGGNISEKTARRIAAALGVPLEELVEEG